MALFALPVLGQQRDAVVGTQGELYQVREGTYGDLFPDQGLGDPASSALALDVTYPDQSHERFLVPGTEAEDLDTNASLLFEGQSDTLFLLWKTEKGNIHTWLNVVGFHDGGWEQPIEVSGNLFGWKSDPQFAVTRDTFRSVEDDGTLRTWTRTVIHLLWWEEENIGEPVPYYAPVTLIDGAYTGSNRVYRLDELLADALASAEPVAPNFDLARAQTIGAGTNSHSVALGFVDPLHGQMVSCTIELIPGEVTSIADKIRAQISDLGRQLLPAQASSLASKVRAQISDLGNRLSLQVALTRYLADQAQAEILSSDPEEPASHLADKIRAQISDLGARLTDRRLMTRSDTDTVPMVEDLARDETAAPVPTSQILVLVTSVLPSPATGSDEVALHLSRNGRETLVSWLADGIVFYRESRGQGWSAPRPLHLGPNLDLAHAHQLLDQRAEERGVE